MPRLLSEIDGSPIAWGAMVALIIAIVGGIYSYGQLAQRVVTLEELRPMQLTAKLATIEAYQARMITDLGRLQMDIAELRRQLGEPRQWDRRNGSGPR